MGNYTEINVCFDLLKNTPEKIVNILQHLIEGTEIPTELPDHDFLNVTDGSVLHAVTVIILMDKPAAK